jgi:plasmid stabilization system protein ParE
MSYAVSLLRSARNEYLDAVTYYAERSRAAAEGFILNFRLTVEEISESPLRWPNYQANFRECLVKDYPFTIVYRIDERKNTVVIISVFHQSRHPRGKYGSTPFKAGL